MNVYDDDLLEHLHRREKQLLVNPCYMQQQTDFSVQIRAIVLNWLIEVHCYFQLLSDTLFSAMSLFDRYLSRCKNPLPRSRLQATAATVLWMASKLEEQMDLHLLDLVDISAGTFEADDLVHIEMRICKFLAFDLNAPTILHFLRHLSIVGQHDAQRHTLCKYFAEIMMVSYEFLVFTPSQCAATAVFLARSSDWPTELATASGYSESDLQQCISLLKSTLKQKTSLRGLDAINTKYRHPVYYKVADLDFN